MFIIYCVLLVLIVCTITCGVVIYSAIGKYQRDTARHNMQLQQYIVESLHKLNIHIVELNNANMAAVAQQFGAQQALLEQHKLTVLQLIQDNLWQALSEIRLQLQGTLTEHTKTLTEKMTQLTTTTATNLTNIKQHVEQSLSAEFTKTTETFVNIIERLAVIDAAQQQLADLSTNVVDLRTILHDKRSRGTLGEVQLANLVKNVLPAQHFALQAQLSTNKRPDCLLFLPEPTGNIAIDAKFPLENFRALMNDNLSSSEKRSYEQQFRQDIKRHIQDIASKYIIPGETSNAALMFIPAETIFAEIHSNYPDLVELAHRSRVWMVSPTTLMAILTTAKAALKDADTAKQVHLIQQHLRLLAKDFQRFQERMANVSKHIEQAHHDVQQVSTSAQKITRHFFAIESVELPVLGAEADTTQ